ncbi:MAG: hypothetical protein COT61_00535, partial [Candidatus Portnoybacteria bacterium CG09_land_8_20_14_0_10_44_13]
PEVEIEHTAVCADGIIPALIKTSVMLHNTEAMPRDYEFFIVSAKLFIRGEIYQRTSHTTLAEFLKTVPFVAKREINGFLLEWDGKAEYTLKT